MNIIVKANIDSSLDLVEEQESKLKEEINYINSKYHDIDGCLQFDPGYSYMCLGQNEMGDNIVLVSSTGRVFELPYDEKYIECD